jgi:uncharacterized protein DUF4232
MRAALALLAVLAAVAAAAAPAARALDPRCAGEQLHGTFAVVPGSAGAGNIVYKLVLKNVSSAPCTVTGLPQGQLLGRTHNPLPTHVRAANPGALAAVLVTLLPGQSTVATARFSPDVAGTGDSMSRRCQPVSYWFRVRGQGGGITVVPVKPPTSVCERGTLSFSAYGTRG